MVKTLAPFFAFPRGVLKVCVAANSERRFSCAASAAHFLIYEVDYMGHEKELTGYPSIDKPWLRYYSDEAKNTEMPKCTAFDYLWNSNKEYLSNTALNYFGRKISFLELFKNIEKTAGAFQALGINPGDVVVFTTVTTPETIYSFYALSRLGAISNMVDPRTSVDGIRSYISEVNAKILVTLDVAYPKIVKAIEGTTIEKVIVVSLSDSLKAVLKALYRIKYRTEKLDGKCFRWKDFISQSISQVKDVPYEEDRCCLIVHTGGTTGAPKGVMLSNENLNALVLQSILTQIDMQRFHTWMDIMPPFIAYGIGMGIHLPLVIGMETILLPSFDPNKFDELLLKYKPIHMVFVPSYWGTIIKSDKLKNKDLSFIIAPTVGGDTMDINLERKANQFLKEHGCHYKVTKGYGMTEVCAGIAGTVDENNEEGSVGIPFVKTVVSIFKPDSEEELSYGEIGEICITGPNVMLGYYENEIATKEIIRVHKDGKKWVHSGDMGYMNERGSIFIVDRMKRMIVRYDGFKVFPSAIESVISSHQNVEQCCVVRIKDSNHSQGDLPAVFIVKKGTCDEMTLKKELISRCNKELPEYAQPKVWNFIDSIPHTPIGKVDYLSLEKKLVE